MLSLKTKKKMLSIIYNIFLVKMRCTQKWNFCNLVFIIYFWSRWDALWNEIPLANYVSVEELCWLGRLSHKLRNSEWPKNENTVKIYERHSEKSQGAVQDCFQ